jgi:hypothetical protein
MLLTLNRAAVAGFSSTLSFANRTRPAISDASSSITGAIIRHGGHHGAHMSSTTGSGERSTSAENVASVTVTGLWWTGSISTSRPCGHDGLPMLQHETRRHHDRVNVAIFNLGVTIKWCAKAVC